MSASKRQLTSRDLLRFQMADDPQVSPDGTQVAWVKTWMDAEYNGYRANIYVTDIRTRDTRRLTSGEGQDTHPRWSPDGRFVTYLATPGPSGGEAAPEGKVPVASSVGVLSGGPQLLAIPAGGGEAWRLTDLEGGARAPAWSPDGCRLAVTTYIDPDRGLAPEAAADPDDWYARYNRDVLTVSRLRWKSDSLGFVGDHYRHVVLVPFDAESRQAKTPTLLTNGRYDLGSPAWSPDGAHLAVAGNINPEGEAVRKQFIYLLEAAADTAVQPQELFGLEEMRSTDLVWSPDGATIAVCGHDDPVLGHYGIQKLWLVSVPEGTGRCVTDHIDITLGDYSRDYDLRRYGGDDGPRWLPDGTGLYVLANEAGTVHLNRFSLDDGTLVPLTAGDRSVIAFSVDAGGETIVALVGACAESGDLYVVEPEYGAVDNLRRLTNVNEELRSEVDLPLTERFRFESDGLTMDAWIVHPPDRQAGQKYPVILYTGGGPGGMRASIFNYEFHLYAAHGYAVIRCNTRGNYGYGQAFSAATRGAWGDLDYKDNIACLEAAIEQFDYIDSEKRAVAGGSYGGYSAAWIISRHPEFKAAVVDRCLFNRMSFDTSDIGFLLDQVEFDKQLPWEAPDRYLHRSPMQHVGGVQTPTLVVHSALDHRCPVEQGEQLYMALQRLGVPTELVRFPNETHDLSRSGRPWHRVYRLDRYLDWFERWLCPDGPPSGITDD